MFAVISKLDYWASISYRMRQRLQLFDELKAMGVPAARLRELVHVIVGECSMRTMVYQANRESGQSHNEAMQNAYEGSGFHDGLPLFGDTCIGR